MIIKIIYAIMFIAGGVGMIKYRRSLKGWTGNFVWAEQYLGRGGTYTAIIMMGLALIFFGVTYPFGGLELIFGPKNY